jgi:hypothetical protein
MQKHTTPERLELPIFATGKQRLTIRPWCQLICSKELNEKVVKCLQYIQHIEADKTMQKAAKSGRALVPAL